LLLVQAGMWNVIAQKSGQLYILAGLLLAFFVAFNILEASQPSLVSRIAPAAARGSAMGVYNTLQAIGLFCGAAAGGWLSQYFGASYVFLFASILSLAWLIIAFSMRNLPRRGAVQQPAAI
jgi:predicted MFS family arabinose efflux permease